MMRKKQPYVAPKSLSGAGDQDMTGVGLYPDEFPVYMTHASIPSEASILSDVDVPIGGVVRPFILHSNWCAHPDPTISMPEAADIARCSQCGAYVNAYCDLNTSRWFCSLCGSHNKIEKNQMRYRQNDLKALHEVNDFMTDFVMPLSPGEKCTPTPLSQRPLVHLLLVQENMRMDTLQFALDAILASIGSMHPDVSVALVTYGNRVGVYSLGSSEGGVEEDLGSVKGSQGRVLAQYSRYHGDGEEGSLAVPLEDVCNFWDTIKPIGQCRESLENALQAVFESSCADLDDQNTQTLPMPHLLQSLHQWITQSTARTRSHRAKKSADSHPNHKGSGVYDWSKLWYVFNTEEGLGMGAEVRPEEIGDRCMGIVMHMFSDCDAPAALSTSTSTSMDLTSLAGILASIHVSVYVWGTCMFDTYNDHHHLANTHPIVYNTGGCAYKIVMGVDRAASLVHFTSLLTNALTQRIGTKVMMKIRTPPSLQIDTVMGGYLPSASHDGVLSIPCVNSSQCVGFELTYKGAGFDEGGGGEWVGGGRMQRSMCVIQIAVSFEMIVEKRDGGDGEGVSDGEDKLFGIQIDSINQALGEFDIPTLDRQMVYELLHEPPYGNTAQKAMLRNTFMHHTQGYMPHRHHRQLFVARVLRVITVGMDVTHKLLPFLQSSNYPVLANLMLRKVFHGLLQEDNVSQVHTHSHTQHADSTSMMLSILQHKEQHVLERGILNLIGRVMVSMYNLKHKPSANKASSAGDGSAAGPGNSLDKTKSMLKDLIAASPASELVFLLSSALIRCLQSNLIESMENKLVYGSQYADKLVVFMQTILQFSPDVVSTMLSPRLTGIHDDNSLVHESLALSRDSLISSGCSSFLLDAGCELILYRTLKGGGSHKNRQQSTSASDSDKATTKTEEPQMTFVEMIHKRNALLTNVVGHVVRRMAHSPIPPIPLKAEAGTSTAAYVAPYLLLDESLAPMSYSQILDVIIEVTATLVA